MKLSQTEPLANEFKCMVLDEYLAATTFEQFEAAFNRLKSENTYKTLPRYAREGIRQYRQGILDVISRLKGNPVSVEMRSGRKRRRRRRVEVPDNIKKLQPGQWHRHHNGGGWVSETAVVADTAYIARGCAVLDQAQVLDHAKLLGQVRIADRAIIKDQAVLRGKSVLHDDAILQDAVVIAGQVDVGGHTRLGGNMRIGGKLVLRGNLELGSRSHKMSQPEATSN